MDSLTHKDLGMLLLLCGRTPTDQPEYDPLEISSMYGHGAYAILHKLKELGLVQTGQFREGVRKHMYRLTQAGLNVVCRCTLEDFPESEINYMRLRDMLPDFIPAGKYKAPIPNCVPVEKYKASPPSTSHSETLNEQIRRTLTQVAPSDRPALSILEIEKQAGPVSDDDRLALMRLGRIEKLLASPVVPAQYRITELGLLELLRGNTSKLLSALLRPQQ